MQDVKIYEIEIQVLVLCILYVCSDLYDSKVKFHF